MSKTNREIYRAQMDAVKASQALRQKIERFAAEPAQENQTPKRKHRNWKYAAAGAMAAVLVCVLLLASFPFPVSSSSGMVNLMAGISPRAQAASVSAMDENFLRAQADFSVKLLQKASEKGKNSLVSPFSVTSALAMTANGADGNTLSQFQQLLGGGIPLEELNRQYAAWANRLTANGSKLKSANSVWYGKDRVTVQKEFLRSNADYYKADAYQADFGSRDIVAQINGWVKNHTGGKIDRVVQSVDPQTVMYLINALYFEDDWSSPYYTGENKDYEEFHTPNGTVTRQFLTSREDYLHDNRAQGMYKPFQDERYAFVAILPNEGIDLDSYVSGLTGEQFLNLVKSKDDRADFKLPKFKYEYETQLNESLKALGLTDAFQPEQADFSKMGSTPGGSLFIGSVLHKTFLQVDEAGAKAGAVTEVMMTLSSAPEDFKKVVFNRPFVCAIVDTQTNLPIFLGTVTDPLQ